MWRLLCRLCARVLFGMLRILLSKLLSKCLRQYVYLNGKWRSLGMDSLGFHRFTHWDCGTNCTICCLKLIFYKPIPRYNFSWNRLIICYLVYLLHTPISLNYNIFIPDFYRRKVLKPMKNKLIIVEFRSESSFFCTQN